ncbi:hypothetical protein Q0Z83_044840 [Actinoplanes sichuanensis]|nr:hypothetical protein Q0Z83_044840 [Actinoplanes sichuanensis]
MISGAGSAGAATAEVAGVRADTATAATANMDVAGILTRPVLSVPSTCLAAADRGNRGGGVETALTWR